MTAFIYSIVAIAPVDDVAIINAFLNGRGDGPGNLSIRLTDGGGAVTHMGCRSQSVTDWSTDLPAIAAAVDPAEFGLTSDELDALLARAVVHAVDVRSAPGGLLDDRGQFSPDAHFASVIAGVSVFIDKSDAP